ncbi:peptidylprolyl isomerase [Paracoccus alkanivorans]|uniref:Parvulin-like PPIase n=1 Tax=Paracoccus alkanivorans TaxID=2116655 RepID=A0A3M0MCA7_9RHOB|nr:peptidylprolyl isomerase [Paracoccus alkanivorans]RMC33924.1 peptidylprolyl isomerase [Paracoccus alkanivorans]
MRQLLSGIAISASLLLGQLAPASAQNLFEPVLYINDKAITRYEVDQRQRFMRLLGAPDIDQQGAEDALVQDRLRMFAAEQMGIETTEEALQAGLEEFAGRAGMSSAEFTAALERAGVEYQVFRDFVEAGVAWRGVIRQRLLPQINVSDAEVDQAMKRAIETPIVTRVLLSELVIPAPEGREDSAMQLANSIVASNPSDDQFAEAAREYSAADSARAGGRLNWLNIDNLPPSLRPVILNLQPGQTTQPLNVPGAVVLFRLRDSQGTLRPGAREQVLDYMTLRLASASDAAQLAARVRSCADLYVQAGSGISPQINRQTVSQGQIPTLIATQLASLDPDEATVVNYGNSADVVMLCSRQPALLADDGADVPTSAEEPDGVEAAVPNPAGIPDRQAVREEIFNRKANEMANAYLEELRADAVIRRP